MTISASLPVYAGLFLLILAPGRAQGQVPTKASQPRLVVPAEQPTVPPPGQPTTAAPEAPAAAPAPVPASGEVTPLPASGGVTPLPVTPPTTASSSQAATADKRSYSAAKSALVVDGQNAVVRSVEGGTISAEVVAEKTLDGLSPKKHIGGVKVEEISVTAGLDSKPLNDWIAASWKGTARKNGSVLAMDYDYRVVGQRDFTDAVITKTIMPALDASSKDAARITVNFLPEMIRAVPSTGASPPGNAGKSSKQWAAANFRFEMDGLDGSKVSKISPITVVRSAEEHPAGELRDYQKEPGKIDFQNLEVTFAANTAQTWASWHDDFVVKGNSNDEKERNGAIVYLSAARTEELGRVNLFHCGIIRLSPDKVEAGRDAISRITAELYCERMELAAK